MISVWGGPGALGEATGPISLSQGGSDNYVSEAKSHPGVQY